MPQRRRSAQHVRVEDGRRGPVLRQQGSVRRHLLERIEDDELVAVVASGGFGREVTNSVFAAHRAIAFSKGHAIMPEVLDADGIGHQAVNQRRHGLAGAQIEANFQLILEAIVD